MFCCTTIPCRRRLNSLRIKYDTYPINICWFKLLTIDTEQVRCFPNSKEYRSHANLPRKLGIHVYFLIVTEISRGESWSGRVCCPLPQSETCKRACVVATSQSDLSHGCRQSDEIAFFGCLDRQSSGETCCAHARTDGCRGACTDIFKSHLTPTRQQRNLVVDQCEFSSPKVLNCVRNFTKVTPVTNLHKRKLLFTSLYWLPNWARKIFSFCGKRKIY